MRKPNNLTLKRNPYKIRNVKISNEFGDLQHTVRRAYSGHFFHKKIEICPE